MIEQLTEKITSIKEVLSTMPQNNKKNKTKYLEYVSSLLEEYQDLEQEVKQELLSRQEKLLTKMKKNTIDFSGLEQEKKDDEEKIFILNPYNTPYEKMDLDRLIYEIMHFYKDDFDALNEDINSTISCFKEAGIPLATKDFCYSPYVEEYMNLILKESSKEILKTSFDNIYWKCPNIIFQIALNFKYLYYKNEKKVKKYYQIKTSKINIGLEELTKKYHEVILNEQQEEEQDLSQLFSKFLNKTLNIADYAEEKIEKLETSLAKEAIEIDTIYKFYDSLYEYQGYLKYSYIIEEFIKLYQEKDKYKNIYKNTLKEIKKQESKIFKINHQIKRQEKYFKKSNKKNILLLNLNEQIDIVKTKYNELEFHKFYELISNLDDNTSYYDILSISLSYPIYLREIIEKNKEGITDLEINQELSSLQEFLLRPNLTILNNIKIKEKIDIALVISDRYKLLNLNISKDDIENNIASLMDSLSKIKISHIIKNSQVTYQELLFLYNIQNILKV